MFHNKTGFINAEFLPLAFVGKVNKKNDVSSLAILSYTYRVYPNLLLKSGVNF